MPLSTRLFAVLPNEGLHYRLVIFIGIGGRGHAWIFYSFSNVEKPSSQAPNFAHGTPFLAMFS